jgi:hypothetical protein
MHCVLFASTAGFRSYLRALSAGDLSKQHLSSPQSPPTGSDAFDFCRSPFFLFGCIVPSATHLRWHQVLAAALQVRPVSFLDTLFFPPRYDARIRLLADQ